VPTYYMNEGAFDVSGAALLDRTVHALVGTHPEHGPLDLAVRRAEFPSGKSLRDLVAEHLERESTRYARYAVVDISPVDLSGVPALTVTSHLDHEREGRLYRKQTHLGLGETWLSITLTVRMPSRAACDAWHAHVIGSLSLREAGA
jgi:hypothetical protein